MKLTRRLETPLWVTILGAVLFSSIFCSTLTAQTTLATPADASAPADDNTLAPQGSSSAVEDITNQPSWLRDSWLQSLTAKGSPLHFGLATSEVYDDNIFISPKKTGDFVTSISPDLDLEMGDRTAPHANYFNLYFAPTVFLYQNNPAQNREDYDADLYYQYSWTRLTLGLEQHWQQLTDTDLDIGNFAVRNIYTTNLTGNYVYNGQLTFYGTATQKITSYQNKGQASTNEWFVDGYALYQVAPKLALGGGPKVGWIDIIGAPNESYQDLLFHLSYNPEGKISLVFAGGMEYLQHQANSTPSHLLPIFEFTGNYLPQDGTTLSFLGSRQSVPSYAFNGQNISITNFEASIRQRFVQDVYFTLSSGYTIADYEFGSANVGPYRDDRYFSAGCEVEWDPRKWLKLSAFYNRFQDDSNIPQNTFNDNKIGVEAAVNF